MNLNELTEIQQRFDRSRETNFPWSQPVTADDHSALLHNTVGLAGEVGELANLVKKFDRGDFPFAKLISELPGELADILIYVIKISYQSGIDLEAAMLHKLEENEIRFPPR
ncbi:nucleotide pyrophosphohydrolase [Rhodococcus sp. AD45-ID]|uniref:MazG nucleotide pyrophosphohydrolase domain-containing protein n=1 Tax=unclassified Rhodococcus (in: high G+C Gram-positive bacteria) TaxID=192944 RepID=UPI0005E76B16|nr:MULTISPECIES: MazG nucleotide pyrophosphohydrolase domain-containing protein [unclassified Rhodococcus (in: high G+C Gram-positive bacteria)]KJF20138.1 MazG nucleotide pyrophosphohydrolase domain protein [Rhodococcus sp. AD45]PSR41240.1 nucleotide pyrophosphohydrolase [Rhodococcus sp. AD45-ID]